MGAPGTQPQGPPPSENGANAETSAGPPPAQAFNSAYPAPQQDPEAARTAAPPPVTGWAPPPGAPPSAAAPPSTAGYAPPHSAAGYAPPAGVPPAAGFRPPPGALLEKKERCALSMIAAVLLFYKRPALLATRVLHKPNDAGTPMIPLYPMPVAGIPIRPPRVRHAAWPPHGTPPLATLI